jgi:hypothetical protein
MPHELLSELCRRHAALRWTMARIRTSNHERVATLFDEFAEALAQHLQTIDDLILPLLHPGDMPAPAGQYVDAHWYLKRNLADLQAMDRRGESFRKRLFAVARQLEHQMAQEETTLPYLLRGETPVAGADPLPSPSGPARRAAAVVAQPSVRSAPEAFAQRLRRLVHQPR